MIVHNNRNILEIVTKSLRSSRCDGCGTPSESRLVCNHCAQALCDKCTRDHNTEQCVTAGCERESRLGRCTVCAESVVSYLEHFVNGKADMYPFYVIQDLVNNVNRLNRMFELGREDWV